jgi:hypothetical protein
LAGHVQRLRKIKQATGNAEDLERLSASCTGKSVVWPRVETKAFQGIITQLGND